MSIGPVSGQRTLLERPEKVRVLRIDPEFQALIPPLSKGELAGLEESLVMEGCRDALIVWKETGILLDGHNRLTLCTKIDIFYRTVEISLPDREAARKWIIANQTKGRRNLTAMGLSYLRGSLYLASKRAGQRSDLIFGQNVQRLTLAERLASEANVDEKTIRRDAAFALAVDILASNCGEETKQLILSSDALLTRKDTERLARLSPQAQRKWIEKIRKTGRRPRWPDDGSKGTITMPREPAALVQALMRKLTPEEAEETYRLWSAAMDAQGADTGSLQPATICE